MIAEYQHPSVLPATLKLNPISAAITHWYMYWLVPDYSVTQSWRYMDFLPQLVDAQDTPKCLTLALPAVALAHLARRFHQPHLAILASAHYGRALTHLNESLRIPKHQKSDAVLATVILLGFYEVCILSPDVTIFSTLASDASGFGKCRLTTCRW